MRPFASFDIIGSFLSTTFASSEDACARACCSSSACVGYTFHGRMLGASARSTSLTIGGVPTLGEVSTVVATAPCVLLSSVDQLVPSSMLSGGIKPSALGS